MEQGMHSWCDSVSTCSKQLVDSVIRLSFFPRLHVLSSVASPYFNEYYDVKNCSVKPKIYGLFYQTLEFVLIPTRK